MSEEVSLKFAHSRLETTMKERQHLVAELKRRNLHHITEGDLEILNRYWDTLHRELNWRAVIAEAEEQE